jgi:hypothetical protein
MLADMQLRALKPAKKIYKVADRRGLYAAVTPSGAVSFRYDYRVSSRRETLVIGRYDPSLSARKPRRPDELGFGANEFKKAKISAPSTTDDGRRKAVTVIKRFRIPHHMILRDRFGNVTKPHSPLPFILTGYLQFHRRSDRWVGCEAASQ